MQLFGDLTGCTLLLIEDARAVALSNVLLGRESDTDGELDEMVQSSLSEAGNIVAAAYLNALSSNDGYGAVTLDPHLRTGRCWRVAERGIARSGGCE